MVLMSTHSIHFHDKIRNFPQDVLQICFLEMNFLNLKNSLNQSCKSSHWCSNQWGLLGVVGWCEVMYFTSPGCPIDIGLQLGKACYSCSRRWKRGKFLFLLFVHFHSCSSFFLVPFFQLFNCLFYLFSPFLWETTKNDPQGLTCR